MQPGENTTLTSLEGEFVLPNSDSGKIPQPMIWVAGGVGITPFMSMAQWLIDTNTQVDAILYYANKSTEDIGFSSLLDKAQSIGIKTVYLTDQAPAQQPWTGRVGFITPDMVKQDAPDYLKRRVYISGPEPMVLAYLKMFKQMGIANSQIKRDYFPGY